MCRFCATDPPSYGQAKGPAIGGAKRALHASEWCVPSENHSPPWGVSPRQPPHFANRCKYAELIDLTTHCRSCICKTCQSASIHEVGDGRPT